MTAAPTPRVDVTGTDWLRVTAIAGLVLAVAALLLLAAGPVGWRAGWWGYRVALATLMPYAFFTGVVAMAISGIALITALGRTAWHIIVVAACGVIIGGVAAYFPWHLYQMRGTSPPFHDITTDAENPPSFAFAAAMRAAENGAGVAYPGNAAALQAKYDPDIVPALLDLPPDQAFDRALAVVTAKRWTIVSADAKTGIIDAYDKSFWFGFTDDIAIRVTPDGEGSRVDIRSGSRQGRGDFGVNAARVRGFLTAIKTQPS